MHPDIELAIGLIRSGAIADAVDCSLPSVATERVFA